MPLSTFSNTLFIGKVFLTMEKLDSTNTHAIELLSKNNPSEGTVISAWNQADGRGQIGRKWQSEAGKNLTFSIIFYPDFLPAKQQFILNQAIALGVYDFVNRFLDNVKIKWPNDIYVGDKKICGILIQNVLSGMNIQSSVTGIGMNINQAEFDNSIPNPTSLFLETNTQFDLMPLLGIFCEKIETRYLQLRAGNYSLIQNDYLKNLYRFQEPSLFQYTEGEIFNGKIVGLMESGKLIIHHNKGEESFDMRQVIFLI
ncbi:MAG: BirA family biotin operon repressor/biotin-[acetyl-CoA-carboxylase] ligase [Saprospiraceae bacterium]|jgi:BirA family biotin operon repressor/biotin-[acetyl-CoA-carboxylase] ligase